MQSNRGKDNRPEFAPRSAVHRRGLRFRKHVCSLPGLRCEADVVFPTERVAGFLDGCFWHGCPEHATRPATNADWWADKLTTNVAPNDRKTNALRAAGWGIVFVLEHVDTTTADLVEKTVRARRSLSHPLRIVPR